MFPVSVIHIIIYLLHKPVYCQFPPARQQHSVLNTVKSPPSADCPNSTLHAAYFKPSNFRQIIPDTPAYGTPWSGCGIFFWPVLVSDSWRRRRFHEYAICNGDLSGYCALNVWTVWCLKCNVFLTTKNCTLIVGGGNVQLLRCSSAFRRSFELMIR